MNGNDEQVIAALLMEVFFVAYLVIAFGLAVFMGNYMSIHDYEPHGYGPTGTILASVAWWDICIALYSIWSNAILIIPFYAIIQAAPEGAFSLKRKE